MVQKRSRPAPLAAGTGLGWISSPASTRDNSKNLPQFQADFVAARFGLDGVRAKLTAELAWWRA